MSAPRRVFITGATGFVGRALVPRLQRAGYTIVAWSRSAERARQLLGADVELVDGPLDSMAVLSALRGCDAIVNLAGEPIAGHRWTATRRRALRQSRIALTESLINAIHASGARPAVLVSASAVGFYGDRSDETLTEESASGGDFLANLCIGWEAAAARAESLGARVVLLRFGVVLGRGGGALGTMLPPFRVGLGGPVGSGRQYFPWIHLHDLVDVVSTALADVRYHGPINVVAPEQVTSREFAHTLGRVLKRPAIAPLPAFVLRAVFGESAIVLLGSQRVAPSQLLRLEFHWHFPTLQTALDDVVRDHAAAIVATPTGKDGSYELLAHSIVQAPIADTFAFFSRAENLGLLTPAAMKFSMRSSPPTMRAGVTIDYRLVVGAVPLGWRSRIAEWEPGQTFVDVQEKGPYKVWHHRHTFRDLGSQTMVEDRVVYTPPFGPIGRMAHRFFIAPTLRRIFQYRSDVIRLRFGQK